MRLALVEARKGAMKNRGKNSTHNGPHEKNNVVRLEERTIQQSQQLAELEQAAEKSSHPRSIQRDALKQGTTERKVTKTDKAWFIGYGLILAVLALLLGLLHWKGSVLEAQVLGRVQSYTRGAMLVVAVLVLAKGVEVFALGRLSNAVARFNLKRILRLVVLLAVGAIAISVLFVNWYSAVVSLGLISLILGFALQTPISSVIGWIYILAMAPYRVGDRIKMGAARGDVIDVSYLDTTLWEFGEDYLSSDHPSGRIIKFPNSTVFNTPVYNYSWSLFPYIWNEIKFHIAYESDLEFVGKTMQEIVEAELGDEMLQKVKLYRDILAKTPVDELEVRERPAVFFRVSDNTWLEAIVRYLVHPKESGRVKSRLIPKLLAALNGAPERVLFPKTNAR